jgi:hypothetical protein
LAVRGDLPLPPQCAGFGSDRIALLFPAEDLTARDCLVVRFADFDLLVAIWLILMFNNSIKCCH